MRIQAGEIEQSFLAVRERKSVSTDGEKKTQNVKTKAPRNEGQDMKSCHVQDSGVDREQDVTGRRGTGHRPSDRLSNKRRHLPRGYFLGAWSSRSALWRLTDLPLTYGLRTETGTGKRKTMRMIGRMMRWTRHASLS